MSSNQQAAGQQAQGTPPVAVRSITPPQSWPETEPYWAAANEGRFLLKRCRDTGKAFFYPREHSPFTGGATEWFEASGDATLYTWSVLPRAQPPYCIAYVQLAEGPIMMSNVVTEDFASLHIGQPLRVLFVASDNGQKVPMFAPA